ncbi:hypothetical protein VTK73DRAFT_907 [Phialemonium thermophilum]|uniref:Uncharacterized protein n=1 Tax=Phialemonium thermophilum TaxID=223376 RepID=A0ABR3Y399_9PEZI
MPYYSTGYPFPQNHGQDVPDFQRLGPVDKAAQLGDQQAQTTTVSDPPPDLLTPRTIAAKFAEPTPSVHSLSRGKDKDRGWTSNILPIPGPPPEPTAPGSGSRHSHTSQKSKQSGASSANIPAKDIGGQGWGTDTVWDNEKTDSKMTRNVAGRNHSSSGNDGWNISPPKSDNRWGDGSEKKDGSQPGAPWEAWEANNNTSQDAVRSGQMGDANRNRNDQGNSNASNNTNGGSAHKDAWGSDDIGGYPNSQNGSNHRNISTSCSDNPLPGSMPGAWEADYNNNAVPTGWPGPNGNTNKDGRNSSGSGRGDAREGNDGNGSKSRWDDSSPPWPSWQDPSAAQSTQPDPDPGVW